LHRPRRRRGATHGGATVGDRTSDSASQ